MRRIAVTGTTVAVTLVVLTGLRSLAHSRTVQLFARPVARVVTSDSIVALTFDDGPTPARVDSLIRVLRLRGVRATFFVTGAEVAAG